MEVTQLHNDQSIEDIIHDIPQYANSREQSKIELEYMNYSQITSLGFEEVRAYSHYLFWACYRNKYDIVLEIIKKYKISPFM